MVSSTLNPAVQILGSQNVYGAFQSLNEYLTLLCLSVGDTSGLWPEITSVLASTSRLYWDKSSRCGSRNVNASLPFPRANHGLKREGKKRRSRKRMLEWERAIRRYTRVRDGKRRGYGPSATPRSGLGDMLREWEKHGSETTRSRAILCQKAIMVKGAQGFSS